MLQTGAGEGNEKGTVGFGRSAIVDSGAIEFDTEAGEFAFGINEKLGGDFLKAEFFTETVFLVRLRRRRRGVGGRRAGAGHAPKPALDGFTAHNT